MANPVNEVLVILSADESTSASMTYPERRITLNRTNPSVLIGRSSKMETKNIVAGVDNGWFDSPVMSRTHAEITANLDQRKLQICDKGSMHGTYVNNDRTKIHGHQPQELNDGDKIRFGVPVVRGAATFPPTAVTVKFNFKQTEHIVESSSTFHVPEFDNSDADDDNSDEDVTPKKIFVESMHLSRLQGPLRPGSANTHANSETIDLTQENSDSGSDDDMDSVQDDTYNDDKAYLGSDRARPIDFSSPPPMFPFAKVLENSQMAKTDGDHPSSESEKNVKYDNLEHNDIDSAYQQKAASPAADPINQYAAIDDDRHQKSAQAGFFSPRESSLELGNAAPVIRLAPYLPLASSVPPVSSIVDAQCSSGLFNELDGELDEDGDSIRLSTEDEDEDDGNDEEDNIFDESDAENDHDSDEDQSGHSDMSECEDMDIEEDYSEDEDLDTESCADGQEMRATRSFGIDKLLNDDSKTSWQALAPPIGYMPMPHSMTDHFGPPSYSQRFQPPSYPVNSPGSGFLSNPDPNATFHHSSSMISAALLGLKTGKPEFFAAREENKFAARVDFMSPLGPIHDETKSTSAHTTTSRLVADSGVSHAPKVDSYVSPSVNAYELDGFDSKATSTKPDQAARRTHVGISDIVENCQSSSQAKSKRKAYELSDVKDLESHHRQNNSKTPANGKVDDVSNADDSEIGLKHSSKAAGKRKADEISEVADAEICWDQDRQPSVTVTVTDDSDQATSTNAEADSVKLSTFGEGTVHELSVALLKAPEPTKLVTVAAGASQPEPDQARPSKRLRVFRDLGLAVLSAALVTSGVFSVLVDMAPPL